MNQSVVLIVDDNADSRLVLRAALRKHSYILFL